MTERSDSDLVASSRAGDTAAFAELWKRHASAGRTVASSFTDADPDDVVAEAYARIFSAVKDGRGPETGFRPYLFTTIRNVATSWGRSSRETPIEDAARIQDPRSTEWASTEALDRSLTARAYHSLPANWQEVLWYTEVEEMTPATVAPLVGLTANGVAALAYRAREGLRQAWIQAHISASPEGSDCRWTTERLGAYSRDGLGKRDTARLERHLNECAKCTIVAAEAKNVGSRLALVLLPLLLGAGGAAAYSATLGHGATASTTAATAHALGGAVAAPRVRGARNGLTATGIAVAGVVVVAGIAGAAVLGPRLLGTGRAASVVADGSRGSAGAPGAAPAPAQHAPSTATGAPPTTPAPAVPVTDPDAPREEPPSGEPVHAEPSAPSAPSTTTEPTTPAVPPTTPPAPLISTSIPSGFTTNATTLALTGTGRPGGLVQFAGTPAAAAGARVAALSSSGPARLGQATVLGDGTWTATLDLSALQDGTWTLTATQVVDGVGSPAASVTIAVDRTALPPVVTAVDTGSGASLGRLAPILTGTAEPRAHVTVLDHGVVIASVEADADGVWTTGELITVPVDYELTVRQTDVLGNASTDSAPVGGSAVVPTVAATGAPGTVTIDVHGEPGAQVQVWADGAATSHILTLDAAGDVSATYLWSSGAHRIGVVALIGDRHGVLSDVAVTLP